MYGMASMNTIRETFLSGCVTPHRYSRNLGRNKMTSETRANTQSCQVLTTLVVTCIRKFFRPNLCGLPANDKVRHVRPGRLPLKLLFASKIVAFDTLFLNILCCPCENLLALIHPFPNDAQAVSSLLQSTAKVSLALHHWVFPLWLWSQKNTLHKS